MDCFLGDTKICVRASFWGYNNLTKLTYDPVKRNATLEARGMDFDDAAAIFEGNTLDLVDERFDYGERRVITVGRLAGRMVIVVWTQRGEARHIISMRKANEREERRFAQRLCEN